MATGHGAHAHRCVYDAWYALGSFLVDEDRLSGISVRHVDPDLTLVAHGLREMENMVCCRHN